MKRLILLFFLLLRAPVFADVISDLYIQNKIQFPDGSSFTSAVYKGTGTLSGITVVGATGPTSDYFEHTNIYKLIFNKMTGLYINDTGTNGEAEVTLGSYWHTLYLDDGKSYTPTGEQPLQIKMNTDPTAHGTTMDTNTPTAWTLLIPQSTNGGQSGSGGFDTNTFTTTNIVVAGVTVGGYSNGMIIASNTDFQTILKTMLQKVIAYVYQAPSISISGSPAAGNYEAGRIIAPTVNTIWTKRDAGTLQSYVLYFNGSLVLSNSALNSYTSPMFQITDSTFTFSNAVSFAQGSVSNDNFGNPSPYPNASPVTNGGYSAGTNYTSMSYVGKRYMWYDTDSITNKTLTSSQIRNLTNKSFTYSNGTSFTINIPVGTRRIVIAYPNTSRQLYSVVYVEAGNARVEDTFIEHSATVLGDNDYTGIGYRVYVFTTDDPAGFSSSATYLVTI